MTVRVKIGSFEKDIADVDPSWINEQISRRREAEATVCVQVSIERDAVRLLLTTPNCLHSGGLPRSLTTQENEIVALWNKLHLNQESFTGGNLIAFLSQIR